MKDLNKENLFKEYLNQFLDEHFPKGNKERGVALVMYAWAIIAFQGTMQEFCGECGSDKDGLCLNSCLKCE